MRFPGVAFYLFYSAAIVRPEYSKPVKFFLPFEREKAYLGAKSSRIQVDQAAGKIRLLPGIAFYRATAFVER